MAKAVVDAIIAETLANSKKDFKDVARDYVGQNNCHYITLTKQNFKDTVFYGAIGILRKKELKKLDIEGDQADKIDHIIGNLNTLKGKKLKRELQSIVNYAWNNFEKEYNNTTYVTKDVARKAKKEGDVIKLWMPSMPKDKAPFKVAFFATFRKAPKGELTAILNSSLTEDQQGKGKEQSAGYKSFTRSTQFLHKGERTTGTEQLELMGRTLKGQAPAQEGAKNLSGRLKSKPVSDADLEKAITASLKEAGEDIELGTAGKIAAEKVVLDMILSLSGEYEQDEIVNENSSEYFKSLAVHGTLGPNVLNPSGGKRGEPNDWKAIYPAVIEAIRKNMEAQLGKVVSYEASQPTIDKIGNMAVNNVLRNLKNNIKPRKGLKVSMPSLALVEKANNFKGKTKPVKRSKKKAKGGGLKTSKRSAAGGAAASTANRSINKRRTTGTNISLIALLNSKLPQTIIDNMSPPSLQNRTGRFAGSVRALALASKGGQPNIVYTYDREPYGVFEMATGDSRWATRARDPRTIIDKSIREIAAASMMGRFITTRM